MRRVLSLLVLAYTSAGNAAEVVTVYRNPGPDGKCGCSTVANPLATSLPSSPAPGTGAIAAGAPVAAVPIAGLFGVLGNGAQELNTVGSVPKAPTYSYDGAVVASSGQTPSFSAGVSPVFSNVGLTYPFSPANNYNPAADAAKSAAQTGTPPIGFQLAISSAFVNLQLWFQVIIQGATGTFTTQIGAGGLAIDYTIANTYFTKIGPLIQPGATVVVTTSVTRTVSSIVATATTTIPGGGGNGVDSGARSTSSGISSSASMIATTNSIGQSSSSISGSSTDSIPAGPTSMTSSTLGVSVIPVDSSSSSIAQPVPASNMFVLVDATGRQFGCENGALQVQPVGSTGDVVSINPNTTLTCGATEAFVQQAQTASQMRRRNIAGRAVMNSTQYFGIGLAPFGQAPEFATVFGFSVNSGSLQLVVNGTSLSFALSSGILIAYDPVDGPPAGSETLTVGASSTSVSTTAMPTQTPIAPSVSATGASSVEPSSSVEATGSVSMSVSPSQASTSASDSESSSTSNSVSVSGTTTSSSGALSSTTLSGSSSLSTGGSSPTSAELSSSTTLSDSSSLSSSGTTTSLSTASSVLTNGTTTSSSSTASASASAEPEVTTNGCLLDQSTEKRVFAHMIMGNNFNYDQAAFLADFTKAASYGIDGMALNVGAEAWQLDRTALAYAAAQQLSDAGSCFKVFVSLDMSALTQNLAPDGSYLTPYVNNFKSHPAQFYYEDRHFVSTYGGYQQIDWVGTFINPLLENGINAYFVPAYSINTFAAAAYDTEESSGQFLWNAWPNDAATGNPTDTYISPDLSQEYINNKGSKTFMANVSPWFFTHFDNRVKNFVFKSEGLWQQRWSQLASDLRAGTDFVQITSWNDWGESHYIGPVGPQNPNTLYPEDSFGYDARTWLQVNNNPYPNPAFDDGFGGYLDHGVFGDQAKAWIAAYKTGAPITITAFTGANTQANLDAYYQVADSDRAYVSYRMQYKDAVTNEASDRVPNGADFAEDSIVVDAYLSNGGTAYVTFGLYDGNSTSGAGESYTLPAGKSQTFIPFRNLKGDSGRRCGAVSLSIGTGNGYAIQFDDLKPIMTAAQAAGSTINFNAFTKKTTRFNPI